MRIAIVDDLAAERTLMKERLVRQLGLRGAQAEILEFDSGEAFLAARQKQRFTAVFLDIYMPGRSGMDVARELRKKDADCILVFTTTSTDHALEGFQVRALHYLVKPFSMKELDARLRALVRRARGRQTRSVLRWEDIELDPAAHSATRSGVPLRLSPTGFVILETLLRAAPAVVPRTELEQAIWGDFPPDSDALRTHIHELRQKLDKPFTCPLLKTIPHVGYTLVRHE